jgi:hypothetical protein
VGVCRYRRSGRGPSLDRRTLIADAGVTPCIELRRGCEVEIADTKIMIRVSAIRAACSGIGTLW